MVRPGLRVDAARSQLAQMTAHFRGKLPSLDRFEYAADHYIPRAKPNPGGYWNSFMHFGEHFQPPDSVGRHIAEQKSSARSRPRRTGDMSRNEIAGKQFIDALDDDQLAELFDELLEKFTRERNQEAVEYLSLEEPRTNRWFYIAVAKHKGAVRQRPRC